MRIHCLQHVPFEGPGFISDWALRHGFLLTSTALYAGEALPDPAAFDFLIVMGGPMGVYDQDEYPWLVAEKSFIKGCIRIKKKVLGICLGAQLIADVLGARVYANAHKEIGWHPVHKVPAASRTPFAQVFPDEFFAFHWHGDTFDLPMDAVHLAQSDACRHQAFFYPPATLGLQFHLESSRESIEQLITHCAHELVAAPYIQSSDSIRKGAERIAPSNTCMTAVLDFFHSNGR